MKLHGYHTISEIADALAVSEVWLNDQLAEFMGDKQLTLFGEANYLHRDIELWLNRFPDALRTEQRRMREIAREITPRLTMLNPDDAC